MEKIKLFGVYNSEQKVLKDIFVESIKDDWEINISELDIPKGDFKSPNHNAILKKKHEITFKAIKDNMSRIILCLDVDIQLFGQCMPMILREIENKDILFQSRLVHPAQWKAIDDVNTGFMAIKCNEKTLELFDSLLKADWSKHGNQAQSTINYLLQLKAVKGLKYGAMPEQFWLPKWYTTYPPKDIVLHHAIQVGEEGSLDKDKRTALKVSQLSNVRKYVLANRRNKLWSFLHALQKVPFFIDTLSYTHYKPYSLSWFCKKTMFFIKDPRLPNVVSIARNYFNSVREKDSNTIKSGMEK